MIGRADDETFLTNPNATAAEADGEKCWSDTAHLVKIEDGRPGKFLRADEIGLGTKEQLVVLVDGKLALVTEDGTQALSQIGLNFACRHCHVEGGSATPKTDDELRARATGYHSRP